MWCVGYWIHTAWLWVSLSTMCFLLFTPCHFAMVYSNSQLSEISLIDPEYLLFFLHICFFFFVIFENLQSLAIPSLLPYSICRFCIGLDCDPYALDQCRENLEELEIDNVDLMQVDLSDPKLNPALDKCVDTIIMNPPFGTKHNKGNQFFALHSCLQSHLFVDELFTWA